MSGKTSCSYSANGQIRGLSVLRLSYGLLASDLDAPGVPRRSLPCPGKRRQSRRLGARTLPTRRSPIALQVIVIDASEGTMGDFFESFWCRGLPCQPQRRTIRRAHTPYEAAGDLEEYQELLGMQAAPYTRRTHRLLEASGSVHFLCLGHFGFTH